MSQFSTTPPGLILPPKLDSFVNDYNQNQLFFCVPVQSHFFLFYVCLLMSWFASYVENSVLKASFVCNNVDPPLDGGEHFVFH